MRRFWFLLEEEGGSVFVLCLLHLLQEFDPIQNFSFAGFFHFPCQHKLIQYTVDLVEIEHNIQFTDIAKVTVQQFHKQVNGFQIRQFIVRDIDGNSKEQTRVSSVNQLVTVVFNEIGVFLVAGRDQSVTFRFDAGLFRFRSRCSSTGCGCRWWNIPFRQTCLALAIL